MSNIIRCEEEEDEELENNINNKEHDTNGDNAKI